MNWGIIPILFNIKGHYLFIYSFLGIQQNHYMAAFKILKAFTVDASMSSTIGFKYLLLILLP